MCLERLSRSACHASVDNLSTQGLVTVDVLVRDKLEERGAHKQLVPRSQLLGLDLLAIDEDPVVTLEVRHKVTISFPGQHNVTSRDFVVDELNQVT